MLHDGGESLIITDKKTPILDLLDNLKNICVPNLEHFAIRTGTYGATSRNIQDLQPVTFKSGAPKLSSVAVDYLNHCTKWKLTSTEAFINILLIPTLRNLFLVGDIGVLVYVEDFEDIIPMRNLIHLRLADSWSMSMILPYLRAPLLETLVIHDWLPQGFPTPDYNYAFSSLHTLVFEQSSDYACISWDEISYLHLCSQGTRST